MFATLSAIEVLVKSDTRASDEEKNRVLEALRHKETPVLDETPRVVSFEFARKVLGYGSKAAIYKAVRSGVLKAYYGGKNKQRATGIVLSSIDKRVAS